MTHSTTFDNYKRHIQAQQQWYHQSQPNKAQQRRSNNATPNVAGVGGTLNSASKDAQSLKSGGTELVNYSTSNAAINQHQIQPTSHSANNNNTSTQRSLSHAVASAGQNMTEMPSRAPIGSGLSNGVYERAARQHMAMVNQHHKALQNSGSYVPGSDSQVSGIPMSTVAMMQSSTQPATDKSNNLFKVTANGVNNNNQLLPPGVPGLGHHRQSQNVATKFTTTHDQPQHLLHQVPRHESRGVRNASGQFNTLQRSAQAPGSGHISSTGKIITSMDIGSPMQAANMTHNSPLQHANTSNNHMISHTATKQLDNNTSTIQASPNLFSPQSNNTLQQPTPLRSFTHTADPGIANPLSNGTQAQAPSSVHAEKPQNHSLKPISQQPPVFYQHTMGGGTASASGGNQPAQVQLQQPGPQKKTGQQHSGQTRTGALGTNEQLQKSVFATTSNNSAANVVHSKATKQRHGGHGNMSSSPPNHHQKNIFDGTTHNLHQHKGLPGPRKPAIEQLYENRLHLQKQNQQYQSQFMSAGASVGNPSQNHQHMLTSPGTHGARQGSSSGFAGGAAQKQTVQQMLSQAASNASSNGNYHVVGSSHMRARPGNINLRHPHGDHLVLQGLSIQKAGGGPGGVGAQNTSVSLQKQGQSPPAFFRVMGTGASNARPNGGVNNSNINNNNT